MATKRKKAAIMFALGAGFATICGIPSSLCVFVGMAVFFSLMAIITAMPD